MTGDALPLAIFRDPGVGKTAQVVIGLALVGSLGAIDAGDDSRLSEKIDFDVLDACDRGFEERIFDIGKKFGFVAYFAIVFGIDEALGDKGVQGCGIAIDLGFV